MLHTAQFPHAGSHAMLRGQPVRIHMWGRDGRALVFGKRETYYATADELSPLPQLSTFERWCVERIRSVGGGIITPARLVHADYVAFLEAEGDGITPPSPLSFYWMMRRAGYGRTHAWLADDNGHMHQRACWRLVLAGVKGALN